MLQFEKVISRDLFVTSSVSQNEGRKVTKDPSEKVSHRRDHWKKILHTTGRRRRPWGNPTEHRLTTVTRWRDTSRKDVVSPVVSLKRRQITQHQHRRGCFSPRVRGWTNKSTYKVEEVPTKESDSLSPMRNIDRKDILDLKERNEE